MTGTRRGDGPVERWLHRAARTHVDADRPAGDMPALLRKARAVFLRRARWCAQQADAHIAAPGIRHYRAAAARELRAARLAHRLLMAQRRGAGSMKL